MPDISIIICTYNRCASLRDTLRALKTQKQFEKLSFEIVIVDNNSSDSTRSMVQEEAQDSPWPLVYIFEARQGKSFALSRGIQEAKADLLAFTDDDVIPNHDWVVSIWRAYETYHADAFGGPILPLWIQSPPKWLENEHLWNALSLLNRGPEVIIAKKLDRGLFYGGNMIFKRSVFEEIGLFRADLGVNGAEHFRGEDTEMLERAFRAGKKLMHIPDIVVRHKIPAEQMRRSYIRRMMYLAGRAFPLDVKNKKNHVPRWFIREWLRDGIKSLSAYFQRNFDLGAEHEASFWFQMGRIVATFQRSK